MPAARVDVEPEPDNVADVTADLHQNGTAAAAPPGARSVEVLMLGNVVLHSEDGFPVLVTVSEFAIKMPFWALLTKANLAVEQTLEFGELHPAQLDTVDAPDSVVHPHGTVTERGATVGLKCISNCTAAAALK